MTRPQVPSPFPGRKVRVVLAARNPEFRESTARRLNEEPDLELAATAGDGDSVLALARELLPDVVVMDASLPGTDGIRATEVLGQELPATSVILISDQTDVSLLRRGMQAGARDFLAGPVPADELIASVRTVYEQDAPRRVRFQAGGGRTAARVVNGKIVSFFSPKGGVGRTTMAVNTAIAIRRLTGRAVALVDCNLPFGDVGIVMNLAATKTIADLLPSITELSPEFLDSVLCVHESGVRVLLAPTRPELAELFHPDHVRQIFEALRRHYEYIVVDTWASFHEVILALFDMSSEIVLLTTLDMPAVKNIRLFLDVCDGIRYPKEHVTLVLNRSDSTGGLRIAEIEESIQHRISAHLVSGGQLVTASINRGVPFLLSDPDAEISRNVVELARLLLQPEDRDALQQGAGAAARFVKKPSGLGRLVPGLQSRRQG